MSLTSLESEILEHLGYEWWMIRETSFVLLNIPDIVNPIRNALLESINIHIRNLTGFFFHSKDKSQSFYKGDWTITQLNHNLTTTEMPDMLKNYAIEVNKRMVHITDQRSKTLPKWDIEIASNLLKERISQVKMAFATDFPDKWSGDADEMTSLQRKMLLVAIMFNNANLDGSIPPMDSPGPRAATAPLNFIGGVGATGPAPPRNSSK